MGQPDSSEKRGVDRDILVCCVKTEQINAHIYVRAAAVLGVATIPFFFFSPGLKQFLNSSVFKSMPLEA